VSTLHLRFSQRWLRSTGFWNVTLFDPNPGFVETHRHTRKQEWHFFLLTYSVSRVN
jgi:hypothetical protein